ncbi:MAG: glucose-1-phosphate thymidylyltransferase, partial [Candidatus Aenigmatarchaeota archaeon]
MRPFTDTLPKVMLPVANKPVLQHNLESLEGLVESAVIVIGYRGHEIKRHFGDRFGNIKLSYVEQKEQLGTGHALMQARGEVKGRFIVMMGDDIYSKS